MTSIQTPWFYGWTIVAVAMTYLAIIYGIAIYGFTFWVPYWEADFEAGRGEIMLVFVAIQAGMAIFAAFAGRAADSLPIRWLVLGGSICFAAGLALSAYAQALWQIGLIFSITMVCGLLTGGSITAQALTARWFDRNSGMALGIVSTGTSIGGLLMPLLMVFLQSNFGWREANLWLAGLVMIVIVPASFLIYDSPAKAGIKPTENLHSTNANTHEEEHQDWTLRSILKTGAFWSMACCFTVLSTIFIAFQQNMAPLAQDNGISALAVSTAVAVMAGVMICAKLVFGYLADRVNLRYLYLTTVAALAIMLLILNLYELTYELLLVIACLSGIATGSSMPLSASIIRRSFGPLSFGRVKGLLYTIISFSAVGPWIAGVIYDATGSYDMAWWILGLLLIPATFASSGLSHKTAVEPLTLQRQ
jgi:MFS family permease|tara:strand:+ start:9628 stop:10884 length:1257 start_codon:yes stop_codon:yes gene_type:complete